MSRTEIMLLQVQSTQELFKLWREGKAPLMMVALSWMLGQVGDALGVQPGEEFRVALMEAQKVQFSGCSCGIGSHVLCGSGCIGCRDDTPYCNVHAIQRLCTLVVAC